MLNLQVILVVVIGLIAIFWWRRKPLRDFAAKIPGPPDLPVIGSFHTFFNVKLEDFYSNLVNTSKRFETSFKIWLGPMLFLIIRDPDDMKTILTSEECFDKLGYVYKLYFNYGLFVLEGDEYKLHRKAINPLLTPAAIKSYLPIINKKVKSFIGRFDSRLKPNEVVEFGHLAIDFSFDSFLETFFGVDHVAEGKRMEIVKTVESVVRIGGEKLLKPWLMFEPIFKMSKSYSQNKKSRNELNQFISELMKNHERDYQQKTRSTDRRSNNFIDKLYELRDTMTYEETVESFYNFLAAGFDTSGKTISSVLLFLAIHQDVQERVVEELKTVFASDDDEVNEESLSKMEYLDLVIKESLRLLTIAILIGREVKKDIKLKNFTVPAGAKLLLMIQEVQKDKKYWGDDANDFKPERFSDGNMTNINQNAYLPFSKGARICPGNRYAVMSMKAFLSQFLMKYRVKTDMKIEDLTIEFMFTMNVKQGFLLMFDRR